MKNQLIGLLFCYFLTCQIATGQAPIVKISGAVKYAKVDTFHVTIISDKGHISTETYIGHFWTVYLYNDAHYFVIHECGNDRKIMAVDTYRMDMETIEIDVYFSLPTQAYIYLEKPNSKEYTLQLKSAHWIRHSTIERIRNSF